MKKIYIPLLMGGLLLSASTTIAQKTEAEPTAEKKNVFKINLSSLVFNNYSVQYERAVAKKTSVALGFSVRPKGPLPFANSLQDQYGSSNSDAARAIDQTKLSNMSITPEVRFYLGRKPAPLGFYIAPFARYNEMKFDQMYTFTPSDNKLHTANINGKITSIGGGVLLGAQWGLGKNFSLDWWIVGPIIGSTKGDLSGTDPMGIPAQDRAKIKNDIESADIPGWTLNADVQANTINVNMKGTYYGLRTLGIALGYRF